MPSKAEQIAQLVVAALNAGNTGAVAVIRDSLDTTTRNETPVILVQLADEDSQAFGDSPVTDLDTLRFEVCICVRSANWQTVADDVRVKAHAALVASAGLRNLLGSSLRRDKASWRAEDTDVPYGSCSQLYQCRYLQLHADLSR